MRISFKTLAAVMFAVLVPGSAARAITFNFTGQDLFFLRELSLSSGGLGLTVTAGTFLEANNPSNITFTSRFVDLEPGGLGVNAGLDSRTIDGFFGNDVAVFTFDQNVIVESVGFANVTPGGNFAFGTVSGNSFNRIVDSQLLPIGAQQTAPFGLTAIATQEQRTGQSFGFGAIAEGGVVIDPFFRVLPTDSYFITSLTVTLVPPPADDPVVVPAPVPVPLPASGLLLLGGLVLARSVVGRRRKRS